ncbi:disulfide oxidoreductase [Bacillus siamensis]|uniref:disulfide oxidoreductase n=1 Tax=Bacillus siamensis TaxID=659243 RepID=UPI002E23BDE3|nr:disulfide oxidoreductase [Bacillus siamensis]MED5049252.1 disulfide oxidoreductase [Bacillus siamensis]MED5097495.1 disulfide oxidoreductase [Bacillus siamensis]
MISKTNFIFIAWITSVIATAGSLFFSEVLQYEPCNLCWYQRIAMYIIILGIIYIKKKTHYYIFAVPFCLIGLLISSYHYLYQKFFSFQFSIGCGRVSCSDDYVNVLNFITIPFLSFLSFAFILVCLIFAKQKSKEVEKL